MLTELSLYYNIGYHYKTDPESVSGTRSPQEVIISIPTGRPNDNTKFQ